MSVDAQRLLVVVVRREKSFAATPCLEMRMSVWAEGDDDHFVVGVMGSRCESKLIAQVGQAETGFGSGGGQWSSRAAAAG